MHLSRREFVAGGVAGATLPASSLVAQAAPPLAFSVEVPVDHDRPEQGRFALPCEWGAPPRAGQPTIVVIADAQQYFVRPGGAARLQRELFGSGFNVVAIVGRSRAVPLSRLVMPQGTVDWAAAYRLLNWRQWARDAADVIRSLGVAPQRLGLYGRSGGANLIHRLLTLHPDLGGRAYVQAAVNHELDVRWGLGADRSWSELQSADPALGAALLAWLSAHPERRRDLVLVIQRQHFFEPLETLPAARISAARAFLDGDSARIAELRSRYQIDSLEQMAGTLEGVGAAVRVYEFASPHRDPRGDTGALHPDLEALFHYAFPLAERGYRPPVPSCDWSQLRTQQSDVLQVAGRFDHTCDYRTQIGLNGLTRNSSLLLLDDDHVFHRWTGSGTQPALLQAFFAGGTESPGFRRALAAVDSLRWREG